MEKVFNAPKKRKGTSSNNPKKKSKSNNEEDYSQIISETKNLPPFVQIETKFLLQTRKKSKPFNLEEKIDKWLNSDNNTFDLLSNPSLISLKNGKVKLEKLSIENPQKSHLESMRKGSLESNTIIRSPSPSHLNVLPQNPTNGNYQTGPPGPPIYVNQRMLYQSPSKYKSIYSPNSNPNVSPINNNQMNSNQNYQQKRIGPPSPNYHQYSSPSSSNFYQKSPNLSPHYLSDKSRQMLSNNNTGRIGNNNGSYFLPKSPTRPRSPNIVFSNGSNFQTKTNLISNHNNYGVKYVFPSMYQNSTPGSNTSFNPLYHQNVSYSPSRSPSPNSTSQQPSSPNSTIGMNNNNISSITSSNSVIKNNGSNSHPGNTNSGVGVGSGSGGSTNYLLSTLKQKSKKTSNEQMKKSIAIQRLEDFSSLEKKIFSKMILGRDDEEYYREMISPYSLKKLNSFIRRDFKIQTKQKLILNELNKFHYNDEMMNIPIDFCYLKKYHLEQVNNLIRRFYWNSIDVKDYLLCPENTVIVLYKRLVIGCGFIKNGYIPFIISMPNWSGIEKYILYFLMKSSFRDEFCTHLIIDSFNHQNILNTFFDFGFKIESEIEDYFSNFTSNISNPKAIFLRKKY
eukprot:gene11158-3980_t